MGNELNKKDQNDKGIFKHKPIDEQEQLHIKYEVSGIEGLLPFIGANAYRNVASLNLCIDACYAEGCAISAVGCRLIVQTQWKNIRNINLKSNKIGHGGCFSLIKSNWKCMRFMNLMGNGLTDECYETLVKGNWPQLKSIELNEREGKERRRNRISRRGVSVLKLGVLKRDIQLKPSSFFYFNFAEPQIEEDYFL